MPSNKLILTQQTSVEDIVIFFKHTDPTKQVRARDLGNGLIELYVRKDSFKQLFTDKLRPDFLVKRDYLKAQNHILDIVKKADPAGENSSACAMIKKGLDTHKHDFYLHDFALYLDDALYRKEKLASAKEILEIDGSNVNSLSETATVVNSDDVKKEISMVMNAIENTGDKEIFERNFAALLAVMEKPGPGYQTQPTVIDYNCAIDFFRVWLKEVKETGSDIKDLNNNKSGNEASLAKTALTELAERVTRRGVPLQIDLNGGRMENSDADTIVSNMSTGFSFVTYSSQTANDQPIEKETVLSGNNDDTVEFTTRIYAEKHISEEKDLTAGFEISYQPDRKIDRQFMQSVYNKVEEAINKKMLQNIGSSSTSVTGNMKSSDIYTVHLPILNPFAGQNLKPAEKTMIQTSFAEATQKWVDKYPNLRIKVQLEGNVSTESIQASYRNTRNTPRAT